METISIRDLRGARLRESAGAGQPLAITNHRVLTGVFIPMAAAWLEHLIECSRSEVELAIAESEQAIGSDGSQFTSGAVPRLSRVVEELHAAFNPAVTLPTSQADPPVRTVRIGDIGAEVIERAGEKGQALAIAHDRELIGVIIPVTQDLVRFLIDQNVSRVLYSTGLSEKHIRAATALTTPDSLDAKEETASAVAADG